MLGRAAPLGSDKKRQSEYNEDPARAGFLLSGDTTGVFARCAASIPLSYRRIHRNLTCFSIHRGFLMIFLKISRASVVN
jgi:hypothetical protein